VNDARADDLGPSFNAPRSDEQAAELGRKVYGVFLDWRPIDEGMAAALETSTGVPAAVWLKLEADHEDDR
jgi:hypothetical protein